MAESDKSLQTLNNDHFDKAAAHYDKIPDSELLALRASEHILAEFLKSTSEERLSNAVALDFGCGTGLVSCQVAPKVKQILGVDASEGMLAQFQAKLNDASRTDLAEFNKKIHTVQHLVTFEDPLPEPERTQYLAGDHNGFDMAFTNCVLHHIDDVPALLKALVQKTLKPKDGWLFVIDIEDVDGTSFFYSHHGKGQEHGHAHGHHHGHGEGHGHAHGHHHGHGEGHGHGHAHGEGHGHAHGHHHGHGEGHGHAHGEGHGHDHGEGHVHAHGHSPIELTQADKDQEKLHNFVKHNLGFKTEAMAQMFKDAGLVDVESKRAFGIERDRGDVKIYVNFFITKGRRP